METNSTPTSIAQRELFLQRTLHAPRAKLYRCWTDPQLITQWFTPPPWKTVRAEMDVRSGGASNIVMQSPDGQEFPNRGLYLEVVPNEKLVFTDAFVGAWEPSEKAFMVGTITFEDVADGHTLYTARVRHWSVADREAHEKMGFHEGWGIATQQLEALARRI
ncbi:SRPBCC family protein [Oleiharenicola sp. Vm1]|uniref:SRPBCC family protein n=1 Tax=Oleiharenicola sp. Vm1 TaxID=3398393 RepID=UPI0039F471CF